MPKSMTGFARVDHSAEWGNVVCELKSVNHRFLDLSFRMPDSLRSVEHKLREQIRKELARGKVECNISIKHNVGSAEQMQLDKEVAKSYIDAAQELSAMLSGDTPLNPLDILRLPGVIGAQELDIEALHELVVKTLADSLDLLGQSRQREGDALGKEILGRTKKIRELTAGLVDIVPAIHKGYEEKIRLRLADADIEINQERLEQELILIAQKMDVEEEIDRLNSHLDQIDELVNGTQAIGRKLDFLMQELNREANTLGSKSQGLSQTNTSVELKVLIEQIREQIQNIE
jgi:uncharacterized protein (TIGR00255 family)|tara:strand:- start:10073 stop:10939 length:867 start_codon:yes stop_codon:yes gene_type:complete